MMDLRQYTTEKFAEAINEDAEVIIELMRNNSHLGYTDKPYYNTLMAVERSSIKDSNKEVITKFIYTSLTNRPEHRFYDTKGYSVTLR
jgi:hypothetical protein